MTHLAYQLVVPLAVIGLGACDKKHVESKVVPPGFCKIEVECQPVAARQNAFQEELRKKLIVQGVHKQYLPCGTYKTAKAPNRYWNVVLDTSGCPPTASQQDPHPEQDKIKKPIH